MSREDFSDPEVQAGWLIHQAASTISVLEELPSAVMSQNLQGLEQIHRELEALISRTFDATHNK